MIISVQHTQVFDSPHVQLLVGKRTRRRLNANSIVQLIRSFDAPAGILSFLYHSFLIKMLEPCYSFLCSMSQLPSIYFFCYFVKLLVIIF